MNSYKKNLLIPGMGLLTLNLGLSTEIQLHLREIMLFFLVIIYDKIKRTSYTHWSCALSVSALRIHAAFMLETFISCLTQ